MTAEVAILNNVGIALAADSAVTIGDDAKKIYTSSDKLFHLNASAPVAIMIYGNANFLGIPLETVIKEYRKQCGSSCFDTLEQYYRDFIRWMSAQRKMFPQSTQQLYLKTLIHQFHQRIKHQLVDHIEQSVDFHSGINNSDITAAIKLFLEVRLEAVRRTTRIKGIGKNTVDPIRTLYRRDGDETIDRIFGKLPFDEPCKALLEELTIEMIQREQFGAMSSGIVIAGFGEEEFLPSFYSCEVECMIRNRIRIGNMKTRRIDHEVSACVMPFAEQEMVYSFLNGIEPSFENYMNLRMRNLLKGVTDVVLDTAMAGSNKSEKALRTRVYNALDMLLEEVSTDFEDKKREFWSPAISTVATLPEDELAAMAKALVELTKFRQRISHDPETVGGPIDVAVITKGDGFIWVNRKHYFESDLNPRTMSRYWSGS